MYFYLIKIKQNIMSKIDTIIEILQSVRALTNFYLIKLKEVDHDKVFVCEGKKLNSVNWIIAHLCWTDDFLLVQSTKNDLQIKQEWFEEFGYGSNPDDVKTKLSYDVYIQKLNSNREQIITYLKTINDEQLEEDNALKMSMGNSKALKNILYHAIRHEGIHAGHLGWLCKLHGLETV